MNESVLENLYSIQPTQRKKITKFFNETPKANEDFRDFLSLYNDFLNENNLNINELVKSYVFLCNQMTHSRIHFIKTGSYPTENQEEALNTVYSNKELMTNYLMGLAISQFLWKHHYLLLNFYRNHISTLEKPSSYLEVGAGHGLFLIDFIKAQEECDRIDVVDISEAAISISKGLLESCKVADKVNLFHTDIIEYEPTEKYDFITMGEVLEHLDNPVEILKKLKNLLSKDGELFLSTCVNCPAPDHVYHFKTVEEVRALISSAGFKVVKEIEAPSEDISPEKIEKFKVDISYACIIKGV